VRPYRRTLLETELFGHEKGAFTGARQRSWPFEIAHRGTLLLDEIGDLSLPLQAKILRALEEKSFERVGGTQTLRVDVRVVAATHRNLKARVPSGSSARICSSASPCFPSRFPRCANAAGTSSFWRVTSSRSSPAS
jgi:DNA-binding NtrC family response regulator